MDPRHLPPDFREFLECFNAAGVEYLLVGGHAVSFHGYPRVTSGMILILNRISGADFDQAWARRVRTVYDTVPVNILGIEDLLLNKRASGRAKDLADLENLPKEGPSAP